MCAICRRRAAGFGYTQRPHAVSNAIWLCDSEYCHRAAKEFYAMSAQAFDEYELGAMLEAGRGAGGYLDEIGKTDLKRAERRGMARVPVAIADRVRRRPAPQASYRRTAA